MATNYITPIMDRTPEDVLYARMYQNDLVNKNKGAWNYTDLNRICNNLKYAAEYMYNNGFLSQPYSMQVKTNWTETDIITYEQINSMIINNINNLKTYARSDLPWNHIVAIANIDYRIANWIEENIHMLATQQPIPPDTFTLTVNHGSGSGDYPANTLVPIEADPPEAGKMFSHWSGSHLENITNGEASSTTYRMPNSNVTLVANYTDKVPHELTVITDSGVERVQLTLGQTHAITADPAPANKVFHHWIVEPSQYERNLYEPAATTTFSMPNEDVSLTAFYINRGQKQLVVNNGTGSGWYDYGRYVSVRSNKPSGAVFTRWTGDTQYLTSAVTQEYNSVLIPDVSRIIISANWAIPPATNVQLTVVNGVITSTGQTTGTFNEGDTVSIRANIASEGQTFSGWSKSGGGTISNSDTMNTTITIGSTATTVTANYRTLSYHTLTVTTNSGTTTTTKEQYDYFSVNADPPPSGYTFDLWTGDTSTYNPPGVYHYFQPTSASTGTYMGTSDRTITATYRPLNPHTLTVLQISGNVTYTQAEATTITVTAEAAPEGMRFTGWSKSGEGSISSYSNQTITYTFGNGNCTLTPHYVYTWTVTVVGGTINYRYSSAVLDEGETYRLQCRDLAVYEQFNGWAKNGPGEISNTASTATYFTVGHGNVTITANISQYPDKTLSIYYRDPDTSNETLVSTNTYTYGSRFTITAPIAPNETTFLAWEGDSDLLTPSALNSTATVAGLTKNATLIATYYYPEAPEYYSLNVYDGYPQNGSYAAGSQIIINANRPSQGWEFYKWYGDTQYLVNPDLTLSENAVIMPQRSVVLYAKFTVVGELPLFRVNVVNGTASGTYYTEEGQVEHNESGVYIDVPAGTEVTLTADADVTGWVFDYWDGNFIEAGVDDIITTNNPTIFTMVECDLNITMVRRELDKYTVYPTNATGPGTVYPGTYPISGNLVNTEERHYTFDNWICIDANGDNCITAIAAPTLINTNITITDKDLWITADYTTHYKLTVINGQVDGDPYYYEHQVVVNKIEANTPATGMRFDHWDDPMNIVTDIYAKNPRIVMGNTPATITAIYTSLDESGNSVAITGSNLTNSTIIRRITTSPINGYLELGTIIFDRNGSIGVITELDPDNSNDTDDYRVQKLFYGGNF